MIRNITCLVWSLLIASTALSETRNVRDYGTAADASDALQKTWDACKDRDKLYLPPGTYQFMKRINWTADDRVVDVSARHAVLAWRGTEPGPVLTYGGATQRMLGSHFDGLSIENRATKPWDVDNTGLRLQHLSDFDVRLERIEDFYRGLVLGGIVAYSKPAIAFTAKACKYTLSVDPSDPAWWTNRITFSCHAGGPGTLTGIAPYDSAAFILLPKCNHVPSGWVFRDCDFETNTPGVSLLEGEDLSCSTFDNCWFECGNGRMSIKMAAWSTILRRVTVRGGVPFGVDWDPRIIIEP